MKPRIASVPVQGKKKRSTPIEQRKRFGIKSLFLLLALCVACLPGSRPAVESPPEEPNFPPQEVIPSEPPQEILPTDLPEPTEAVISTEAPVASTPVLPVPDFAEILQFGGGGAGPAFCWEYPSDAGSISIEENGLDDLTVCVFLENVRTDEPIQLTFEHADGTGIRLTSNDLILDHGRYIVYWDGFDEIGSIEGWTRDNNVKFAFSVSWPKTLPSGTWNITASQANGLSAYGSFHYSRPGDESYIAGLDAHSEEEITPDEHFVASQPLRPLDNGGLIVSGGNFPANTPVYILLYSQSSQPVLVQKTAILSDDSGTVFGELAGPFEIGASYILYGITDPNTPLSDPNTVSCYDMVGHSYGAACDYFTVIAEPSLHGAYSTQVPSSCPGAPPQQIVPGQYGYVCTQSEKVNMRDDPSRSGNVIKQLEPGTQFNVSSLEPVCADDWSWWNVRVDNNTPDVQDDVSGWVAEGGDETDPYFICPLP